MMYKMSSKMQLVSNCFGLIDVKDERKKLRKAY